MKKITYQIFLLMFSICSFLQAQDKIQDNSKLEIKLTEENKRNLEETGYVKCLTTETEEILQQKFPQRANEQQFETWIATKIKEIKKEGLANTNNRQQVVITIPVVVHVIHNGQAVGTAPNITDAQVLSQITAMNEDFRKLTGTPGDGTGVDTEIQFCLAQQDPNGNPTDGINRVNLGQPAWSTTDIQSTVKPATQWDPTAYMNMWSVQFSDATLLGYAQFPSNSGLQGLNANGGAANTDGVVAAYSTFGDIGSNDGTFILNAPYDRGRTMTHEVGHFLGLRHIWGDANCGDDYCADTPTQQSASSGNCPATTTCDAIADLTTNYMDYSNDICMNNFTQNQKDRIIAVMANSPRRMELSSSIGCTTPQVFNLDGQVDINNLNLVDCSSSSIEPEILITNKGNNTLTSATINYSLDGGAVSSVNWSGSLTINQTDTILLPLMSLSLGAHTLNVDLSNPNGGTDEQLSNNVDSVAFTANGGVCASVANTTYQTSTEGVILNDGTTDILSNLNTGKPSGYSDYTTIVTDVNRSETYNLTVNANSDGNYQIITYAWIDWNQNCSFDDAGEQYDLGQSANLVNDPTTNSPLSFMVPSDAVLGNTIMRVTTKYTNPNANQFPTSCENNHDAEVEDYTINVLAALNVDDYFLNNGVSIYPNPTVDVLTIKVDNDNDLPNAYKVYNMIGQLITEKTINNTQDLTLDTTPFSNGMYFIKISKAGNAITLPFIKK